MAEATYKFEIDWDNDGDFGGVGGTNLSIAAAYSVAAEAYSGYPSTHPDNQETGLVGDSTGFRHATASRTITTADDNPTTFTKTSTGAWAAATIIVPGVSGAPVWEEYGANWWNASANPATPALSVGDVTDASLIVLGSGANGGTIDTAEIESDGWTFIADPVTMSNGRTVFVVYQAGVTGSPARLNVHFTSGNHRGFAMAWHVSNVDFATSPPTAEIATGGSTTPNPPGDTNPASFGDEDVTLDVRARPVTIRYGKPLTQRLRNIGGGSAEFVLDNQERTYYPDNSSSGLADLILPGRPVHISATHLSTDYDLFDGSLDVLDFDSFKAAKEVRVGCLDGMSELVDVEVATQVYQGITTGTAIGHVLDAIGWPSADRAIDTGATSMPFWWLDRQSAFQAIEDLVNSEGPGARAYVEPDGTFTFHSRLWRTITTRSNTSQATFADTGTEPLFSGLRHNYGWNDVVNDVAVVVPLRSIAASALLWTDDSVRSLSASEVVTVTATLSDPFIDPSGVIAMGDHSAVAVTTTSGSASITDITLRGREVDIEITDAGSGSTITQITLTGQTVTQAGSITVTDSDATSQNDYGKRSYTLRAPWIPNEATATDFAAVIIAERKDPRQVVGVTVNNDNDTRLAQVLDRQIGDRITVTDTESGISDDFTIEHISHRIVDGGKYHEATFSAESVGTPLIAFDDLFILDSGTSAKADVATAPRFKSGVGEDSLYQIFPNVTGFNGWGIRRTTTPTAATGNGILDQDKLGY